MLVMSRERLVRGAVTGIDGAGKDSVLSAAIEVLGENFNIVKISRPAVCIIDGNKVMEFTSVFKAIDLMHSIADRMRNVRAILAVNSVNVMFQTRVVEPALVRKYKPDLIIGARDMLVDPCVYSVFYAGGSLASRGEMERLQIMRRLTATAFRDTIAYLTVDPATAIRRIESRISEESLGRPTLRRKFRHLHEDPENLKLLAETYYRVLAALQSLHPTSILEIKTDDRSRSEVTCMIVDHFRSYMRGERPTQMWVKR